MKTYVDFISDLAADQALLRELDTVAPFPTTEALAAWFAAKGYTLSEADAAMLFENQNSMLEDKEQITY